MSFAHFYLRICSVNFNSICKFANLCIYGFVKLPLDRKGRYLIRLGKVKKQKNIFKYFGMFRHDCSYNIKFIFTNTKPPTFRTPKNQNIPNAPSRCLNFRFSVEDISNLNCLQGGQENAGKQFHYRLIIEAISRFKIVR